MKIRKIYPAAVLIITGLALFLLDRFFPLKYEKLFPDFSRVVYFRDGRVARVYLTRDDKFRVYVPIEKIPAHVVNAFIASEDRWFRYHPGVNLFSVIRALKDNLKAGRVVSGASTITMQVARLMEPKPRTVKSKAIEALRAFQLELHFSKKKILEIYLNITPYGGNIEGIGAASIAYFGVPVEEVSLAQAAVLAALLRSPEKLKPGYDRKKLAEARKRVLFRMWKAGFIPEEEREAAAKEPLPEGRIKIPFEIPHAADWLRKIFPGKREYRTTIDYEMQKGVEKLVRSHYQWISGRGVRNLSVVVIKNKGREILALVGSQDFFSEEGGQIAGFLALRSPGSALKPFLYAIAIEEGMINMETLLRDVPVQFGSYEPRNYGDVYRGLVKAKEALAYSLNVPAVLLLRKTGMERFFYLLKDLGFSSLKSPRYYGLPLILGGCEVSLLELTSAYSVFADKGIYRKPRILMDEPESPGIKVLPEGSCYLISEVLTEHNRPDLPQVWQLSKDLPKIAWKTGTSYGHKDAWSIGFTPHYTVGVWVGNFDGEGVADLVGSEYAAPLLFKIIKFLEMGKPPAWFKKPDDLAEIEVCALSGMLPSDSCPHRKRTFVLANRVPTERCSFHRIFTVDLKEKNVICPELTKWLKYKEKVYTLFPSETLRWLMLRGVELQLPPPVHPACRCDLGGRAPVILSPESEALFVLRPTLPLSKQKIPFIARIRFPATRLYWFVNDELVAVVSPFETFWFLPKQGVHEVYCMDSEGRTSRKIKIRVVKAGRYFY